MVEQNNKKQTLTVNDRKRMALDGVENVIAFDEKYVVLSTDMGRVTVEGHDLKIDSLTKNDRTVVVVGKIDGIYYSDDSHARKGIKALFG